MEVLLDDAIRFCKQNDRMCPMPLYWNNMFNLLKNVKQKPSGGYEPALPLILAAWHDTPPFFKQIRFIDHLKWAEQENHLAEIFTYLKSLPEENWFHLND